MTIEPYIHQCVIQDGDMAGNTYRHEVDAHDYEYEEVCPHCDEVMATTQEIVAHIYRELTA